MDDIYEDVQRPDCCGSNGWSSSEFESCDELSDGDAAPTTSSNRKVAEPPRTPPPVGVTWSRHVCARCAKWFCFSVFELIAVFHSSSFISLNAK